MADPFFATTEEMQGMLVCKVEEAETSWFEVYN